MSDPVRPKPASPVRRRRRAQRVLKLAIAATAVFLVGLIVVAGWFALGLGGGGSGSGAAVQIEIKPGSDTQTIANKLQSANVIHSATWFRVMARVSGADGSLKPGVYDLFTGMSVADSLKQIQEGPPIAYVTVTIPEGYVVEQIATRFAEQAAIPKDEFLMLAKTGASQFAEGHPYLAQAYNGSLEGYLFPKTYRVPKGASAKEVIGMMLDQFDREVAKVNLAQAQRSGLSLNQVVTVASMIERESRIDTERPLVSSVIQNRLRTDSYLKIDATIAYVLGTNRFRLTYDDTKIDSPYNTYTRKGLPPGPISNPGLESLKAAASPPQTQLLYYVLTGKDGSHTFTTNLADFLAAKKKSKQVFGE